MGLLLRLILLLIATTGAALGGSFQNATSVVKCRLEAVEDSGLHSTDEYYIAICTGLDLSRVPDNLHDATVELYLDQNHITVVPSFAFSYMPRLRVLDLSGSNISTLRSNCFGGLYQLEELYLPFNKIASPSQVRCVRVTF